jgi:hypothetical protein
MSDLSVCWSLCCSSVVTTLSIGTVVFTGFVASLVALEPLIGSLEI